MAAVDRRVVFGPEADGAEIGGSNRWRQWSRNRSRESAKQKGRERLDEVDLPLEVLPPPSSCLFPSLLSFCPLLTIGKLQGYCTFS